VLEVEDADSAGGIINRRRLDEDNDEQSPLLRSSSFDSEREFGNRFTPVSHEGLPWYKRPSVSTQLCNVFFWSDLAHRFTGF
jgi:hypothetical protein